MMKVSKKELKNIYKNPASEINPISNLFKFGSVGKDLFAIDYRITTKCNYSCWYCEDLHNNYKKDAYIDYSKLEKLIKILNRDIRFFLYGGEPTLHPQFLETCLNLLKNLSPSSILEIQTNLWLKGKKLDNICSVLKKASIERGVSLHFLVSYHYKECSFNDFLKSCNTLSKYGLLKQISVMYQTENSLVIIKNFKLLKHLYGSFCKMELLPLLCGSVEENSADPYKEIDNFFKDSEALKLSATAHAFAEIYKVELEDGSTYFTSAASLWRERSNSFKDFICDVGKERIVIDSGGECYRCFNEIFDNNFLPRFNIYKDTDFNTFVENLTSFKCPFPKCFFEFCHRKYKS